MSKLNAMWIAIALLVGCVGKPSGSSEQQIGSGMPPDGGPVGMDAPGSGSDAPGIPDGGTGSGGPKVELDPIMEPPIYTDYPDDVYGCSALRARGVSSAACGTCDPEDPYCTSYGDPDTGAPSTCHDLSSPATEYVSCTGPAVDTTKTWLLPSEHTSSINEVFYAYPTAGRSGGFATLPAASSEKLPEPTEGGSRTRISQAGIKEFILRSISAATGKRTGDLGARDHAETTLVQVTVVTNNVDRARGDIIAHLKRPRADGGLALTQEQAEATVGPATDADYTGAGKIRLVRVTGLRTVWIRDFGPHILQLRAGGTKNAEQVVMDFGYHGDRPSDDGVPSALYGLKATLWPGKTMGYIDANRGDAQIKSGDPLANTNWTADGTAGPTNGLKEEGGNLHSDGYGSCLTTWKNLAPDGVAEGDAGGFDHYYRPNDRMTAAQQRTRLHQLLGCDHVTVLPRLPYHYATTTEVGTGDGTGHVDMLTHFYGRDKVLLAESAKGDANCNDYADNFIGQFNKRTCQALRAAKTELLRVGYRDADIKRVPILDYSTTKRSARSTTNIMEVGNRVLYVTYDTMTADEKRALRTTLEAAYGNTRQLFELDASSIIESGGAVHCTSIGFQNLD